MPSSSAPVLRGDQDPIPTPPVRPPKEEPSSSQSSGSKGSGSRPGSQPGSQPDSQGFLSDQPGSSAPPAPVLFDQQGLNDLIRDLGLSKDGGELLTSRLEERNLLLKDVKVTSQRKRHEAFSQFFSFEDGFCYCNDVIGLFEELELSFDPKEWRLFIDGSSKTLEAVLLNNGNTFPSIPLAHSACLKETYGNIQRLLELIQYELFEWEVIGDFKIIAILSGLQGGNTKFPCFLCMWDSRATKLHFVQKEWPKRENFERDKANVLNEPLVDPQKVLLPPLHIKLGLMKQFTKALDRESEAFEHLRSKFPGLSEAKIKAGIFVGPQIKELMKSTIFSEKLEYIEEEEAWNSFVAVVEGFLGNHRAENHVELVETMVKKFGEMGCRMSVKLHMLDAHLGNFKENLGAYSEEQGERFHQDVQEFERRYVGQYDANMMGDYIWNLVRDSPDANHKRKSRRRVHF